MKKIRLLLMFCCILGGLLGKAQSIVISGKVTNKETGEKIEGASVVVGDDKKGVTTNVEGAYTIKVSSKNTVLTVSYVGFTSQSVKVGDKTVINIGLQPVSTALTDVVVIGYGSARKKDLTGSVASVSLANIDKTPVTGTEQLLQGQVSGVQVTQVNAQPGSVFSLRIRGTNSINSGNEPLYVVDGFAGADIGTINPSDIASIDVLKDASATAIYGSRGANGVVIITTKRGTSGKNAVNVEMYMGYQQVSKKMNMMNASQFATYIDSVYSRNGNPLPFTPAQISAFGKGTDWQNELFRVAPISNYVVSFSGGNAETKHFLSFNYFDQNGIVINSGYKRGVLRFNLDKKIGNKIKIGVSSSVAYSYQQKSNVNPNGGNAGAIIGDALIMSPTIPLRDSTGQYTFANAPATYFREVGNPVAAAMNNTDRMQSVGTFFNFHAEYEIVKGLVFKSSFGLNYRDSIENVFYPTTTFLGALTSGSISKTTFNNYNWLNENTLSFDKNFKGIHAVKAVAGFTVQDFRKSNYNATTQNLQTNNLGSNNIAVGQNILIPTSVASENSIVSYFGRVNYGLLSKYLFTFTMRADGSSRFGPNNKWGYFPSGAFAWRLSDENFMKRSKTISDLKLRTSYGITGNQEIGSYNSMLQYSANSYTGGGANSGATNSQVGFYPANIANPNLKWESTSSFDVGVDLGLLQGRITFVADYYYKKTSNLLLQASIPSSSGYTKLLQNIGSVENRGLEFSINTVNIATPKVKWSTSFNIAFNKNKILDLGGQNNVPIGSVSSSLYPGAGKFFSSVLRVGAPVGAFYGYVFDGIWQSQDQITKSGTKQPVKPGDPIYKDLNGDSLLNASDQAIIGYATPKFTYGFSSTLSFGRWNLFVLLQGQYGDNILNENLLQTVNGYTNTNKLAYVGTDSWTGPGSTNTMPAVNSVYRIGLGVTSDLIENGTYLRVKTVTLGYDLPLPKLTKGVFKSANVYITAQNLLTLTKYSGYDPEVNSYGLDGTSLNTDYNSYPNVKTFLIGAKLIF
ncbi:MAG: TonB-dependent receptor [Sphingobacteriia bacterium]|nr:TonB-dependent receptor [Sphingobacteriia bacterium]